MNSKLAKVLMINWHRGPATGPLRRPVGKVSFVRRYFSSLLMTIMQNSLVKLNWSWLSATFIHFTASRYQGALCPGITLPSSQNRLFHSKVINNEIQI